MTPIYSAQPTYVYECRKCERVFEVDQRITADALTDCDCGAKGALRRVIQPVAVSFKGAGFHINDYAPKGTTTEASESKAAEAASETPTSGETKPAESQPVEAKTAEPAPTTPAPKPSSEANS